MKCIHVYAPYACVHVCMYMCMHAWNGMHVPCHISDGTISMPV